MVVKLSDFKDKQRTLLAFKGKKNPQVVEGGNPETGLHVTMTTLHAGLGGLMPTRSSPRRAGDGNPSFTANLSFKHKDERQPCFENSKSRGMLLK